MNKNFKKLSSKATKSVIVPIDELNNIFKDAKSDLRIISRSDDLFESYCNCSDSSIDIKTYATKYHKAKISTKSDTNRPHTTIAGEILGIKIFDWEWVGDGHSVRIDYQEESK